MRFAVRRLGFSAQDTRVLVDPVMKAQEMGSSVQTSMEQFVMHYSDGHHHAHVRSKRIRRVLDRHRRRQRRREREGQA